MRSGRIPLQSDWCRAWRACLHAPGFGDELRDPNHGAGGLRLHHARIEGASRGGDRRQTRHFRAEGRIIHGGSRMGTAEGKLIDKDGKIYAHGTTTCMIMKM